MLLLLLLSHILSPTTATPTAFCEPSKAHVFPEKLTRRKIKVNPVTGEQTFYETSNTSPEQDGLLHEPLVTLTNTTFTEFSYYVRRGYPVVVTDMARDWPMLGWECEDFAREFPDGEMKGEYGGGRVILGERHWMDKVRDAGQHIEQCDTPQCNDRGTKPHAAPHVWHVKDEEPYATRHRIQQMFRVPYFMENDPIGRTLNKPDVNESLEFWLSPPGAGAFAHADAYCTMTASVQLSGHKRWRMMNPGPQVDSVFDRFDTQDSGIYRVSKWDPEYEFIVPKGGGVVFPPYNIHETIADTTQCTTATTFNFFSPQPTRYIRSFLPRLTHTHLGYSERCGRQWDRYATFIETEGYRYHPRDSSKQPHPPFQPSTKIDDIERHCQWILDNVNIKDANNAKDAKDTPHGSKDEELSLEEIIQYFKTHPNGAWGRDIRYHTGFAFGRVHKYYQLYGSEIHDALIVSIANDTMVYHDLNDDEIITKEELMDSLVQWHSVKSRLHKVQQGMEQGARKLMDEEHALEEFQKDMEKLEQDIARDTSLLNKNNPMKDEVPSDSCIGPLKVTDARPAMSDFEPTLPYWALSLDEHSVMQLMGEAEDEPRDFGQEEEFHMNHDEL